MAEEGGGKAMNDLKRKRSYVKKRITGKHP